MTNNKKTDRRIGRTRKLLQDALIQLLKEKPFAKIRIKEIAEVANLSRPSFYAHFETKEKLLFSLLNDLFDEIGSFVFGGAKNIDASEMPTLLAKFYEQWLSHHEQLAWVMQIENKDMLIESLRVHVSAFKVEFDKHMPPVESSHAYETYLIDFFAGGIYMLLKRWMDTEMRETPEEMGTLTFLLLQNGISSTHAIRGSHNLSM